MRKSLIPLGLLRRNFATTKLTSAGTSTRIVDGGRSHADNSSETSTTSGSKRDHGPQDSQNSPLTYRSWELHSYSENHNGPDLQLATRTRRPILQTPTDVLVQVKAASLNPIDVAMTKGYGHGAINFLRDLESTTKNWTTLPSTELFSVLRRHERIEFPLVLGRDFAGVIVQVGHGVTSLSVGDEVYGVCGIQRPGSHSDFVVTSDYLVRKKPLSLDFVEAASIPYVGLTSWSAIRLTGGYQNLLNKKFLVLGGSGGVGSFLIQYLKANGAYVVSTCSLDATELLESIRCDVIVDYKTTDYASQIKQNAPFDCIVDLTGSNQQSGLIHNLQSGVGQYITLSPPFLSNIDKYGLCGGLARNLNDIVWENYKSFQTKAIPTKWAFFAPLGYPLENFSALIERGSIKPIIQEVFTFENLPAAYEKLERGHARGKIVIDFQNK